MRVDVVSRHTAVPAAAADDGCIDTMLGDEPPYDGRELLPRVASCCYRETSANVRVRGVVIPAQAGIK
jgi:hypothetical protein